MKIKKLHLVNVKIHEDKEFDFNGSTMILGHNGAGKSTIVESIYYALFRELLVPNVDAMINNKIKKTDPSTGKISYTKAGYIELQLEHEGKEYLIKSPLCKCNGSLKQLQVLPDLGETWVEISNKITDMYAYIQSNILHNMTAEYFINSVYTEQMGILNLVSQTESVRQKEFDKLIGITKFQSIYDAVTKTFTVANKMVRDDIDEVKNRLASEKSSLIDEFKRRDDITNENQKTVNIINEYAQKEIECNNHRNDVNNRLSFLSNLHSTLVDKNTNYSVLKHALETDTQQLKNIESDIKNLNDTLIDPNYENDYSYIVKVINTVIAYEQTISDQLKVLYGKVSTYNTDMNNYNNYLERKKKLQDDIKHYEEEYNNYVNQDNEYSSERAELLRSQQECEKSHNLLVEQRDDCHKKMTIMLMSYSDKLHNYIKGITNDPGFTLGTTAVCQHCKSVIVYDEAFKERLDETRKQYLGFSQLYLDLDSKEKESKVSLDRLNNNLHRINMYIDGAEDQTVRMLEAIARAKKDIDSLTVYNEPDCDINAINNEIAKLQNMSVNSYPSYSKALPFYNGKETDPDVDSCYDKIRSQSFEELIDKTVQTGHALEDKRNRLASLNHMLNSTNSTIINKQNQISALKDEMTKLLIDNGFKSVSLCGTEVENVTKQLNDINEELTNIRIKINEYRSSVSSNNSILRMINNNITNREAEIQKLETVIANNQIITEKIKMINVAKAYFKQDGLAKFVRKFYIDKINEKMKDYVSLFNFDFIPVIDETAGIENYHMYSGGQKIAIAILMKMILNFVLNNPINIMILDEPTPYMDTERVEAITDLVSSIKDKLQVIVITHDEEFMKIDCNKIELN